MEQSAVEWLQSKLKNVEYNPLEKNGYSNALERLYNQAKEMEKQQQNELAIEFVNWIFNPDTTDLLHDLELIGEIDKEVTSKKLLEIYKKQKGL